MTSRFEQSRQGDARTAQIAAQSEKLKRWLEIAHPDIRYGEAVKLAFMEDMGDSFLTATHEDFEYSLSTTGTIFSRRRVPTEAETKAALIDKICELIASADGTGRDGKFSTYQLEQERSKMTRWDLSALTSRLEQVVRKQTLSAKPVYELQQIVESAREYQGYPQLPKQIVRPGTVRAVPLDAGYLRSQDPWGLKKFVRLYGIDQVNDRLAGRN